MNGSLRFRYEDSYCKDPSAIFFSFWIHIEEEEMVGTHVQNYLENLLQEGELRDLISKAIQVSKENICSFLSILAAIWPETFPFSCLGNSQSKDGISDPPLPDSKMA